MERSQNILVRILVITLLFVMSIGAVSAATVTVDKNDNSNPNFIQEAILPVTHEFGDSSVTRSYENGKVVFDIDTSLSCDYPNEGFANLYIDQDNDGVVDYQLENTVCTTSELTLWEYDNSSWSAVWNENNSVDTTEIPNTGIEVDEDEMIVKLPVSGSNYSTGDSFKYGIHTTNDGNDDDNFGSGGADWKKTDTSEFSSVPAVPVESGDTVEVKSGVYHGTIDVENRENLVIKGEGNSTKLVPHSTLGWNVGGYGEGRQSVLRIVDSESITIENFYMNFSDIAGDQKYGILFWNSEGDIKNNVLSDISVLDKYYEMISYIRAPSYTNDQRAEITVEGNTFVDTGRVGVATHDYVNVDITDNIFLNKKGDFGYAIEVGSESTGKVNGNTIVGYDTAAATDGSNSAGIYIENAFTNDVSTPFTKDVEVQGNTVSNSQIGIAIGQAYNGFSSNVGIVVDLEENNIFNNSLSGITIVDENANEGSSVTVNANNNIIRNNGKSAYNLYTSGESYSDGDGNITLSIKKDEIIGNNLGVNLTDNGQKSFYEVSIDNAVFVNNTDGIKNNVNDMVIKAENNFWNAESGPSGTNSGIGQSVSENVDFSPWCTNETCSIVRNVRVDLSTTDTFNNLQSAVDASSDNDLVEIANGTYNQDFTVNKPLTIVGESSEGVIINASGLSGATGCSPKSVICVTADNVTLKNFMIDGERSDGSIKNGIKLRDVANVDVEAVTVQGIFQQKTGYTAGNGFDIIISENVSLRNVASFDNGGAGFFVKNVQGITFDSVKTDKNPWGGVALATDGSPYSNPNTTDVNFKGNNEFNETSQGVNSIYIEVEDGGNPISYSFSNQTDVDFTNSGMEYALHAEQDDAPIKRVAFFNDFETVKNASEIVPYGHFTGTDRVIEDISGSWYVHGGMNVQTAVEKASTGDTIYLEENVTFTEDVTINKDNLTIVGGSGTQIKGVSTGYKGVITLENGVSGFTLQNVDLNGTGKAALLAKLNVEDVKVSNSDLIAASGKNALLTQDGFKGAEFTDVSFTAKGQVPQLVYINGEASLSETSEDVTFNNVVFEGSTSPGGLLVGTEVDNLVIKNSEFNALNADYGILELFGDNVKIMDNTFSHNVTSTSAGYSIIVDGAAENARIEGNTFSKSELGTQGMSGIAHIYLEGTDKTTIVDNTITNGPIAGSVTGNSRLTVTGNTISNVVDEGFWLTSSFNQLTFKDNTIQNVGLNNNSNNASVKFVSPIATINKETDTSKFKSVLFADNTIDSISASWIPSTCVTDFAGNLSAASEGETIYLCNGTYEGQTVTTDGVKIIGQGNVTINSSITLNADNVRFENLNIVGPGKNVASRGIEFQTGNVGAGTVVQDVSISEFKSGIYINPVDASSNTIKIIDSEFSNNFAGIGGDSYTGVLIKGNRFENNTEAVGYSNHSIASRNEGPKIRENVIEVQNGTNSVAAYFGAGAIDARYNYFSIDPATSTKDNVTYLPYYRTENLNSLRYSPSGNLTQVNESEGFNLSVSGEGQVLSQVEIPGNTTMNVTNGTWDGNFEGPVVKNNPSQNPTPSSPGNTVTTDLTISVGSDSADLSLNNAARLNLTGQAGKSAGYIDSQDFSPITTTCNADNRSAANSQLGPKGSCKIDVGGDLIIWTNHFTEYVAYTETSPSPSGGGGGGGSSEDYEITLSEDTDERLALEQDDTVEITFEGTTYTFEATDISNNDVVLTYDEEEFSFEVGDASTYDLNGDNSNDLRVTLDESDTFDATFTFEGIAPESSDVEVVESTQNDQAPEETEQEDSGSANQGTSDEGTTTDSGNTVSDSLDQGSVNANNQAAPQGGLGGFITANTPTVVGAIIALLVILAIIGGLVYQRRRNAASNKKQK